jgi:hypothetical protein
MSKPLPPPLLTLFTHPSCSLCTSAKHALSHAWEKRPFQYEEIDVYSKEAEQDGWDLYRMDVPVVRFFFFFFFFYLFVCGMLLSLPFPGSWSISSDKLKERLLTRFLVAYSMGERAWQEARDHAQS